MEKANKKGSENFAYVANIALRLLVICAFIAALVAAVNYITKDKIAMNQKKATAEALSSIYAEQNMVFSVSEDGSSYIVSDLNGNTVGSCESLSGEFEADIDAVYVIKDTDSQVLGYCVEASPMGFKDEIGILVAVNPDVTLKELSIISLKDTKGIGDKVMLPDFLDKFKNKSPGFAGTEQGLKEMVISGATRTSEPVTKAADTALKQIQKIVAGEEEK